MDTEFGLQAAPESPGPPSKEGLAGSKREGGPGGSPGGAAADGAAAAAAWVRTDEDVVRFFEQGGHAAIKFFFCNRSGWGAPACRRLQLPCEVVRRHCARPHHRPASAAPPLAGHRAPQEPGGAFEPFNLVVVRPEEAAEEEHFTFSPREVLRFAAGEVAEALPLTGTRGATGRAEAGAGGRGAVRAGRRSCAARLLGHSELEGAGPRQAGPSPSQAAAAAALVRRVGAAEALLPGAAPEEVFLQLYPGQVLRHLVEGKSSGRPPLGLPGPASLERMHCMQQAPDASWPLLSNTAGHRCGSQSI